VIGFLVKDRILQPQHGIQLKVGQQLTIPGGIHNKETIVLALSAQCHYCQSSLPFYRKLLSGRKVLAGTVDAIAVFPQPTSVAEDFLGKGSIRTRVVSMPLTRLGTPYTPTVLQIDERQHVKHIWVGQLTSVDEREIIELVQ
jgi:hypothetical protein